jgi:hypothetical protein
MQRLLLLTSIYFFVACSCKQELENSQFIKQKEIAFIQNFDSLSKCVNYIESKYLSGNKLGDYTMVTFMPGKYSASLRNIIYDQELNNYLKRANINNIVFYQDKGCKSNTAFSKIVFEDNDDANLYFHYYKCSNMQSFNGKDQFSNRLVYIKRINDFCELVYEK